MSNSKERNKVYELERTSEAWLNGYYKLFEYRLFHVCVWYVVFLQAYYSEYHWYSFVIGWFIADLIGAIGHVWNDHLTDFTKANQSSIRYHPKKLPLSVDYHHINVFSTEECTTFELVSWMFVFIVICLPLFGLLTFFPDNDSLRGIIVVCSIFALHSEYVHHMSHCYVFDKTSVPFWYPILYKLRLVISPQHHRIHHTIYYSNFGVFHGQTDYFLNWLYKLLIDKYSDFDYSIESKPNFVRYSAISDKKDKGNGKTGSGNGIRTKRVVPGLFKFWKNYVLDIVYAREYSPGNGWCDM